MLIEEFIKILKKVNDLPDLSGGNVVKEIKNEFILAIELEEGKTIEAEYEDREEDNNFEVDHSFEFGSDYMHIFLHHAAEHGYENVVNALIENGANVNAVDDNGCTPLHLAAMHGHTEVVGLLLSKKADVHAAENKYRFTPLYSAAMKGHTKVAELLLDEGANANSADDKHGWTPLHWAARNDSTQLAKLLLAKGASPISKDKAGETPIDFAKCEMRKVLEKAKEKQSKKVTDSFIQDDSDKKQSEDSVTTSFFSQHKWEIALIADFAVGIAIGTIFVFATSLNVGIAVGLGCIIFGAIIGGAAYMLSEPKSEVTVEQTPVEQIVSEVLTPA